MHTYHGNIIEYANCTFAPTLQVDARAINESKIELRVEVWINSTGSGVRVRRNYHDFTGFSYSDETAGKDFITAKGDINAGAWTIPVTLTNSEQTISFGAYFDIAYNVSESRGGNQRSYIQIDDYKVPSKASGAAVPLAPANLKAYRIKGANVIRWDNLSRPNASYGYYAIYRKELGTVQYLYVYSLRTTAVPESYVDRSIDEDKAYIYRIHTHTGAHQSKYLESNVVYTDNVSPSSVEVVRNDDGSVTLTWDDVTDIEDNYRVDRYLDGKRTQLDMLPANTTTYTDTNPPLGRLKYSVNAVVQGTGSNATYTREISSIQKPLAPRVFNFASNVLSPKTHKLRWQHHSIDGLPQTSAKVRIIDLTTNTEKVINVDGDAQSLDIDFTSYKDHELQIAVSVTTSHSTSDETLISPVLIKKPPVITVVSPTNNKVVTSLPLELSATADDATNWHITLYESYRSVYRVVGTGKNLSAILQANTYVPKNNSSYKVYFTAYKSYEGYQSISSTVVTRFTTDYIAPEEPNVEITRAPDYSALVKVNFVEGDVATHHIALYRLNDDGTTELLQDYMRDGDTYQDDFAPLGNNNYRAIAFAESGTPTSIDVVDPYKPEECILNYGDNWQHFIRLAYNPKFSYEVTHPENVTFQPASSLDGGDALPVIYTSDAITRSVDWDGNLDSREDNKKAYDAANFNGVFLWRDAIGRRCACVAQSNQGIKIGYNMLGDITSVSIDLTEVRDDRLD